MRLRSVTYEDEGDVLVLNDEGQLLTAVLAADGALEVASQRLQWDGRQWIDEFWTPLPLGEHPRLSAADGGPVCALFDDGQGRYTLADPEPSLSFFTFQGEDLIYLASGDGHENLAAWLEGYAGWERVRADAEPRFAQRVLIADRAALARLVPDPGAATVEPAALGVRSRLSPLAARLG